MGTGMSFRGVPPRDRQVRKPGIRPSGWVSGAVPESCVIRLSASPGDAGRQRFYGLRNIRCRGEIAFVRGVFCRRRAVSGKPVFNGFVLSQRVAAGRILFSGTCWMPYVCGDGVQSSGENTRMSDSATRRPRGRLNHSAAVSIWHALRSCSKTAAIRPVNSRS